MEIATVKQGGFDVSVHGRTPWLDLNIVTEVICNDEYGLMQLKAAMGDVETILDIGGHVGTFGLFAKALWPNARLIAVEPDPSNHTLYVKNLSQNGFLGPTDHVLLGAVGYDPASSFLVHSPSTTGGHLMRTKAEAEKYISEGYRFYNRITDDQVNLFTIEDIMEQCGLEQVDLAKWDCEGGEVDAFKNISLDAASKFRFMVGEYHLWKARSDAPASYDEQNTYLRPPLFYCTRFWRMVKRKFPHLNFYYKHNSLGLFQAWPK
jgi:FkbM family methyltransferase